MLGREKRQARKRRVVPAQPEAAEAEALERLAGFTGSVAKRCYGALKRNEIRLAHWHVSFGDATDVQVEGRCFDAARVGRDGQKALRWQTVTLGPVLVGQRLHEGNRDEGRSMPALLDDSQRVIAQCLRPKDRVLALYDAAYFEKLVVEKFEAFDWDFIVCANPQRAVLERMAAEQPEHIWTACGADARRGWIESQTGCFVHLPKDWKTPVTIVGRRWREEGDLPGVWHYSFLATRLEKGDLPGRLLKRHGYAPTLWMLYGTKQGHENHYKTPLRDLGLHHPPSGRLGVNQAFYALAAAASNVAMVLRYRVVQGEERGIELWRLRQRYFQIAARVTRTARTVTVWLSGICVSALRQTLWRAAFAEAGQF